MTEIIIREYEDQDFDQLLQLNLEDQSNWFFGTPDGTLSQRKARWEELTPYERWLHGGWWLDPETLKLYIHVIKKTGSKIFVAEHNEQLIGECDLSIGFDPEFGQLRGHLMWLLTKPTHRKKGVAQKLLSHAMTYLKTRNAEELFTEAEDERSENLYKKIGFIQKTTIVKKFLNNPVGLDEGLIERLDERYNLKEIKFDEIPFNTQIRILGTYYTPIWDVYRCESLPELYDILGVPVPDPKPVEIIDKRDNTKYYGILDQNPRLWIPKKTSMLIIKELIFLLITESYYEAHGPELLLQYYSKNNPLVEFIQDLNGKTETLPLYYKRF